MALTYFMLRKADTSTYGVTSASVKSCMRKLQVRNRKVHYSPLAFHEARNCLQGFVVSLLTTAPSQAF